MSSLYCYKNKVCHLVKKTKFVILNEVKDLRYHERVISYHELFVIPNRAKAR